MSTHRAPIAPAPPVQLPAGVADLDEVLGGGIPEHSCTVIAGGPGTGKTTLALQMLFANASAARAGVYFTGPAEPPHKLQRHQQPLAYFLKDKLNRAVHIVNLDKHLVDGDSARLLETISRELEDRRAGFVVIDLVRTLTPGALWQDLALYLTRSEATSFLVTDDDPSNPILSSADTVLWLRQSLDGEALVRSLQVLKARGQQPLPGLHAARLTWTGMQVFPRWPTPEPRVQYTNPPVRLPSGIAELDPVLGGGIPAGDTVLVEGPSGTGKSILATQFVAEGSVRGERGVVFLFEERPDRFIARGEALRLELDLVKVLSFRGGELSADELIHEVQRAVARIGARRVVFDSVAGLEMVLNTSRGVRDCLWRLLDALSGAGVTVWLNSTPDAARPLAHLVDDLIELRRIEHDGHVAHCLAVVKMRSSAHSADARQYDIGLHGVRLAPREVERPRNGNGNTNGNGNGNGHMLEYALSRIG